MGKLKRNIVCELYPFVECMDVYVMTLYLTYMSSSVDRFSFAQPPPKQYDHTLDEKNVPLDKWKRMCSN